MPPWWTPPGDAHALMNQLPGGAARTATEAALHVVRVSPETEEVRPAILGRPHGVCWDNALAESFNASLKNELVNRTAFPTKAHAKDAVVQYIELYCNRQRIHSALG